MNSEIIEWCREQGLSDRTAFWLIQHEEELLDVSSQELDEIIYWLERN